MKLFFKRRLKESFDGKGDVEIDAGIDLADDRQKLFNEAIKSVVKQNLFDSVEEALTRMCYSEDEWRQTELAINEYKKQIDEFRSNYKPKSLLDDPEKELTEIIKEKYPEADVMIMPYDCRKRGFQKKFYLSAFIERLIESSIEEEITNGE